MIHMNAVYIPSNDVVAREIEGELIIVPLVAGMGDLEDELFTLNETGKDIWDRLDGQHDLDQIVSELSVEYDSPPAEIEADVRGFVEELLRRRMLVESAAGSLPA